ncbi:MAG: thiamine diphosphokinase [Actinomycetota bacterium]
MTTKGARAIILAGGEFRTPPPAVESALVIAADSGYDHARNHDIAVDLLVGDLDSVSSDGLAHARQAGVEIEEHPVDKDSTDLELAIRAARKRRATTIDIYAGEGGRIGHLLSIALLIAGAEASSVPIVWHTASGDVQAATSHRSVHLHGAAGQNVTVLPIGEAHGVTTSGLRWTLDDSSLTRGTSLGVSNELSSTTATVEVSEGAVLVILETPEGT